MLAEQEKVLDMKNKKLGFYSSNCCLSILSCGGQEEGHEYRTSKEDFKWKLRTLVQEGSERHTKTSKSHEEKQNREKARFSTRGLMVTRNARGRNG